MAEKRLEPALMRDIVEWDVPTWQHAVRGWQQALAAYLPDGQGKTVLEIGARHGGVSLFFALRGFDCFCTDKVVPDNFAAAQALHQKYGVQDKMRYELVDCTELPYPDESFDVVVFKSVLGHVGRDGQEQRIPLAISEMRRVLKPGGLLLFAENLDASALHRFMRRRFVRWGKQWNYLTLPRLREYLAPFATVELHTYGFWGCMAKDRWLSDVADRLCCRKDVSENHYMCYGWAKK